MSQVLWFALLTPSGQGEGKCPQSLQTVGATEEWYPLPRMAPVLFSRAQGELGTSWRGDWEAQVLSFWASTWSEGITVRGAELWGPGTLGHRKEKKDGLP